MTLDLRAGLALWLSLLFPLGLGAQEFLATGKRESFSMTFPMSQRGHLRGTLRARAPETRWDNPESPARVLEILSERGRECHLVLHHGETPFDYEFLLGPFEAGEHHFDVRLLPPHLLSKDSPGVAVESLGFETLEAGSPEALRAAQAPIVLSRNQDFTDLVLSGYFRADRQETTLIYSHEDGGTPGPELMSRWGRLQDIEWATRIEADGSTKYQGRAHRTKSFRGPFEGGHPVVRVVTQNNMLGAAPEHWRDLEHSFIFRPWIYEAPDLATGSRENFLDQHPWIYQVSEWERTREIAEDPEDPHKKGVSDLRNYLIFEVQAELKEVKIGPFPPPKFLKGAHLTFEVETQGGEVYRSHRDEDPKVYGIYRNGWQRTALELPAGTKPEDITRVEAVFLGRGKLSAPTLRFAQPRMLDESFSVQVLPFQFSGSLKGKHGVRQELERRSPGSLQLDS